MICEKIGATITVRIPATAMDKPPIAPSISPISSAFAVPIAVDVEEDTYWIEVEFEKAVVEWEHFLNKVQA